MQRFIRILAIVAAVLVAVSLCLLLLSFPLQRFIAGTWLQYPDDMIALLPIFPWVQFMQASLLLGCAVLLIVCAGNKRGGIWLEIVLIGCIAIVLPLVIHLVSLFVNVVQGNFRGSMYIAANSIVSTVSSYCMWPASWGSALALVTAGMSITFKHMSKKMVKAVTE